MLAVWALIAVSPFMNKVCASAVNTTPSKISSNISLVWKVGLIRNKNGNNAIVAIAS